MQTSQQNQRRFGTTSIAGSTADWLLTWHTHKPDIKNATALFCTKDNRNVHCKISNKLDHGEKVMEKFCEAIVSF